MNMLGLFQSLSLPFLNKSSLSSKEKNLLLQACAYVAWSDGTASVAELTAFKNDVSAIGGFHTSEIEKVFSEKVLLTGDLALSLKALEPPKAHAILKLLFLISNADGNISDEELKAIRAVCELMMPKHTWEDVYKWIASYKTFIDATKSLFGKV
jgi:tellurite resistance protein